VYEPWFGLELDGGEGGAVDAVETLLLTSPTGSRCVALAAVLGGGVPTGAEVG